MAWSVEYVEAVQSWTAANETGDDLVLDFDPTDCMTDGTTTGQACDEWKEGVLNVKVIIAVEPSALLSLAVRFWCDEAMTAGPNTLFPYTDPNSVSEDGKDAQDYLSSDEWVEHACDSAFLAALGDVGGGMIAVRLASEASAKSKLGEVQIDVTYYTIAIDGVTRDKAGDPLVSCEYQIFKRTGLAPETWQLKASGVSDGATGAYSEDMMRATYRVASLKDVTPQVMDLGPPLIQAQALASNDEFTLGAYHNFANDDEVYVYQPSGASLPGAITEDTLYYIVNLSGDVCELSLSQGGSAVNVTSDGDCILVGKPETS